MKHADLLSKFNEVNTYYMQKLKSGYSKELCQEFKEDGIIRLSISLQEYLRQDLEPYLIVQANSIFKYYILVIENHLALGK